MKYKNSNISDDKYNLFQSTFFALWPSNKDAVGELEKGGSL